PPLPAPPPQTPAPRRADNLASGRRVPSPSPQSRVRRPARGPATWEASPGSGGGGEGGGGGGEVGGGETRDALGVPSACAWAGAIAGKRRTNRAPPPVEGRRSRSPPASRAVWREIYRPSPVPRRPLVVANGRNSRAAISGATPRPLSATATETMAFSTQVSTVRWRGGGIARSASMALESRLTTTCSSLMVSPETG